LINREIAFQVGLSPRTVEGLLDDARSVLGAENRPHLVARAIELGVIKPRDWAALRLLTERQLDVAAAQARGLSRAQIAAELRVEDATVATHLTRARRATGCRTSSELAALIASERRCSSPPSSAGAMDELIDELARTVLVHDAANSKNDGLIPA
jgi:DNA-binding NarL/FixJ family response regulator